MTENHCKICDYGDLDIEDEWYCEYWGCLISEIEDCDDRQVDGM